MHLSFARSLFGRLRLLVVSLWFYGWTVVLAALSYFVSTRRLHQIFDRVCDTTIGLAGIRVRLQGRLPASGAFLLVCNHVNMFDALILYTLTRRPCVVIEKAAHFKRPFYGRFATMLGNLPVASGQTELSRRSMEKAAQALRNGIPVFIFPEGTRHGDGRLGEFKSGAFRLALETRVPVVPVVLRHAEQLLVGGVMRPGTEEVCVLPPFPLDAYRDEDHHALAQDMHALMRAAIEA